MLLRVEFEGRVLPLEVGEADRVADVKRKLENSTGVAVARQQLMTLSGKELRNYLSLKDKVEVEDGATLKLKAYPEDYEMTVFVKTLTGQAMILMVTPCTMVEEFKNKLCQVSGSTSTDIMRLVYGGKQLEDGRSLADYDITNESTVHMVLRLRGGYVLSILLPNGSIVEVAVPPASHMARVKELLLEEHLRGPDMGQLALYYDGQPLEDDRKCQDCPSLPLLLVCKVNGLPLEGAVVGVELANGARVEYPLAEGAKVADVMRLIHRNTTHTGEELYYKGQLLQSEQTLQHYGITSGSSLRTSPLQKKTCLIL